MKLKFFKEQLLAGIQRASGCVSTEDTLKVIKGILFETSGKDECRLCAYDLDRGIKTSIPATVIESGSVVIDGLKLAGIVRYMPGDIEMETDENGILTVTSGKSEYQMHYIRGEDFPMLPEYSCDRSFSLPQYLLKKMCNQTSFAVAKEDQRVALTGLYMKIDENSVTVVACDSFRLAVRVSRCPTFLQAKQEGDTEFNIVMPLKTVCELVKLLEDSEDLIKISLTRKHVVMSMNKKLDDDERELIMFSRLIDVPYVEYERFIPKDSRIFATVNRLLLSESLDRAALVTEDKTAGRIKNRIVCRFEDNLMSITAKSETGRIFESLPIKKQGEDVEVGFSCRNLIDIVRATEEENLKFSLSSPLSSVIVENAEEDEDESFLYLTLPIRIRDVPQGQ